MLMSLDILPEDLKDEAGAAREARVPPGCQRETRKEGLLLTNLLHQASTYGY